MTATSVLEQPKDESSAGESGKRAVDGEGMKILVVDDHALFRQGISMLLKDLFPDAEVVEAASASSALQAANRDDGFRLALVDINLPDADGIETMEKLAKKLPGAAVAIVSASESLKDITKSYRAGARGYFVKSSTSEVMRHALPLILSGEAYIPSNAMAALTNEPTSALAGRSENRPGHTRQASAGAPSLTPRQTQILIEMARGLQNREIADSLGMLEGTVKVHVKGILQKLGVSNRTHAVVKGLRLGLVPQEIVALDDDA